VLIAIPAGAALFGVLGLLALLPVIVFALAVSGSLVLVLGLEAGGAAARRARAAGVPAWLDRLAQWSWRGLVVAGLVWVVIEVTVSLPIVFLPAVLALVLAATLAPLAARLRSLGWSEGLAAATSTAGAAIGVLVILVVAIAWTIGPLRAIVETAIEGAEATDFEWLIGAAGSVGSAIVAAVAGALRGLPGVLITVILALLLTFFLLRDASNLWRRAMDRVHGHQRIRLDTVGTRAVDVLGGYMVGTALIALFGAATGALIMVILGLPLAVPIGILTFFGGFIPYVGSAVTTGLSVLVALAVGTTTDVVVMMIYTIVFNIVQGNFVTPLVYGRTLSLHPAIILLAIPAGGEIAGIMGMFLVVPFVAIVAATWRPILDLLGTDAPPSRPKPAQADTAAPVGAMGSIEPRQP
jgi:predicted PurR-regulated permease PerM